MTLYIAAHDAVIISTNSMRDIVLQIVPGFYREALVFEGKVYFFVSGLFPGLTDLSGYKLFLHSLFVLVQL